MSPKLKAFLQQWLINTVAVLVAANLIRGIDYDGAASLVVASLLLGILNVILRPLLLLLSLPVVILTLGLFTWVINALLLYFVGQLVKSFHVADFWSALWGALIISLVALVLQSLTGTGEQRIGFRRPRRREDRRDDGHGPVIDV
jgi:putative membrane protein